MRLIDANALKKEIHELAIPIFEKMVLKAIDNAPTVELTEEQAIDKLHETGWLIRHDKEMTERPQTFDCTNCKYESQRLIDEPCTDCNRKYSEWEAKDENN